MTIVVGCGPIATRTQVGLKIDHSQPNQNLSDESTWTNVQQRFVKLADTFASSRGFKKTEVSNYHRAYHGTIRSWYVDNVWLLVNFGFFGNESYATFSEDAVNQHTYATSTLIDQFKVECEKEFGREKVGTYTWTVR